MFLSCWLHTSLALHASSVPYSSSVVYRPERVGRLRLCTDGSSDASAFSELMPSLPATVTQALSERGVISPTPIQQAALARAYDGESLLLHAETGSGKSLAFLLPTLARLGLAGLAEVPAELTTRKVLIVTPTRELGVQL